MAFLIIFRSFYKALFINYVTNFAWVCSHRLCSLRDLVWAVFFQMAETKYKYGEISIKGD